MVWEAGMALGQLEGGMDCFWEFIRVGKGGFWNSFGFERMAFGIPWGWKGQFLEFIWVGKHGFGNSLRVGKHGFGNSFGLESIDFRFHWDWRGWVLEFLEGRKGWILESHWVGEDGFGISLRWRGLLLEFLEGWKSWKWGFPWIKGVVFCLSTEVFHGLKGPFSAWALKLSPCLLSLKCWQRSTQNSSLGWVLFWGIPERLRLGRTLKIF